MIQNHIIKGILRQKTLLWVTVVLLLTLIAAGCGAGSFSLEPGTSSPAVISTPIITPGPESATSLIEPVYPGGLSIPEAETLVRSWYAQEKPDLNPQVTTPLVELTTQEIWNRLGVQIFQVNGDIFQYDTFLIQGDTVIHLGSGFGGTGVNSLAVTDLDQDGHPELAYTYSFGSGIHQARLGLYSPVLPGEPIIEANRAFSGGDLHLEKLDDQQVRVLASLPGQGPVQIGELMLQPGEPRPFLEVELSTDIPAEVVEGLNPG
jgi:hypothetical protein